MELLTLSPESLVVSEREIQTAFENRYGHLEPGLKRIASFLTVGVGIIDSLAIDSESNPVIVEFKKVGGSAYDALIQAMDYSVWCRENFSWVEKVISNSGHAEQVFRGLRIIIVAAEFDERIKRAARAVEFDVRLVSFDIYEHEGKSLLAPRIEVDTSVSRASEEPPPPKTKQQHFANLPESILTLYERVEEKVRAFAATEINYQPQGYIGFRYKGRNFVGVHPKRGWLRIDTPLTAEEARIDSYVKYSSGDWGYFHLDQSSFDQGMELVDKAYKKISSTSVAE